VGTDYDAIAAKYKRSKQIPWRTYIESFTFLQLVGRLSGQTVLDLACGEGFYTRLLKTHGASRVLGVDLSRRMIELARASDLESPLGVEYTVGDAREFRTEEQFDLVTAAYLLNYADTEEALAAMCLTISTALKPGGRFVTVNNNPSQSPTRFEATRKYGFTKSISEDLRPGTPITYTVFQDGESFSFENYYLSRSAHDRALARAGLQEIEWLPPLVSPEWQGEPGHWDAFFADPSIVFLQCRKPQLT